MKMVVLGLGFRVVLLAAAGIGNLLIVAREASAAQLLRESFDYAAGTNLPSGAGGTFNGGSFSNPFVKASGWYDNTAPANYGIVTGSLSFTSGTHSIPTAGNRLSSNGDNLLATRTFTGPSSGIYYVSFLWRTEAVPSLYQGMQFGGFYAGLRNGGVRNIGLSRSFGSTNYFVASGTVMESNVTYLMVVRLALQQNGVDQTNDTADLFINQFTEGTPDATLTNVDLGVLNTLIFYSTSAKTCSVDEIRIGTTYDDVLNDPSPPPPPPPPARVAHRDIYIFAGQSNMDGRGYTNELTNGLAFYVGLQSNAVISYFNPAPLYDTPWQAVRGDSGANQGRFGPELGFAREMTLLDPDRPIGIIKVSQGSTSLYYDWSPTNNGHLYSDLTNKFAAAIADITNTVDSYTVQALIWHQGEGDAGAPHNGEYAARFSNFVATLRNDLGLPGLRVMVGGLASNKDAIVQATLRAWPSNDVLGGYASSVDLDTASVSTNGNDFVHFNTPSVIELGKRYADIVRDLDGDGLGDAWETQHFGALTNTHGAATDSDGDGVIDGNEEEAGTDPLDTNDYLRCVATLPGGAGGVAVQWASAYHRTYGVWRSDSLGSTWSNLAAGVAATAPLNTYTDSTVSVTAAFYRVKVEAR